MLISKRYLRLMTGFLLCSTLLAAQDNRPKNIILFIGDGMGIAQITAGRTVKGKLELERFRDLGLLITHSADNYLTDSAAGATALATGVKTYNGAIGVDVNKKPLKTVLEYAEQAGKATGLISTSSVTHATPASFAAHVDSRKKDNEIAEGMSRSGVDVLIGGGLAYFLPESAEGSKRDDELDLLSRLAKPQQIVRTAEAFRAYSGKEKLVALLADKHMGKADERPLTLKEMTRKAIEILSQDEDGFFLMVEGSQIDWGGHGNDTEYIIMEMVDFDAAVGEGLDFAESNGETLVIVTADHETGGFSLEKGSIAEHKVEKGDFTTNYHTAEMVPLLAAGPSARLLTGIHQNTHVGTVMISLIK